jgi:nucleotide-binding universal stress UspA family protein
MGAHSYPCVVVGVDRSLHGLAALRSAAAESVRRGVPLYAVRVEAEPEPSADYPEIGLAFTEALGGPPRGIEVHLELGTMPVAEALLSRVGSERDLLVVGDSRRGGWHAFWAGSVMRACLRSAPCPVLAVPAPQMARTARRQHSWWRHDDVWRRFDAEQPPLRL